LEVWRVNVAPNHTDIHTLGRDLYLTSHNIYKRQTSITQTGFESTIPASEFPQNHASDLAATGSD